MTEEKAVMYVFAGINIAPDSIARSISYDEPEKYRVSAGKEALKLAKYCIANGKDFSIETTLAGGNTINSNLDGKIVLEADQGKIQYISNGLPDWVVPIKNLMPDE